MPPAARLTLVQRQQQLLEERGFSKPKSNQQPKLSFAERQDAAAIKSGRGNATAASRQRVEMPTVSFGMEADDGTDGAASSATRFSCAPSLHPSMAGTAVSMACSEVTIGAGDDVFAISKQAFAQMVADCELDEHTTEVHRVESG